MINLNWIYFYFIITHLIFNINKLFLKINSKINLLKVLNNYWFLIKYYFIFNFISKLKIYFFYLI
jgi:hypothetical protein